VNAAAASGIGDAMPAAESMCLRAADHLALFQQPAAFDRALASFHTRHLGA
jgi:hypothetical protein